MADLPDNNDLIAEIQAAVDDANPAVSRAESIRKFRILGTTSPRRTASSPRRSRCSRNVVAQDLAADIEALYQ